MPTKGEEFPLPAVCTAVPLGGLSEPLFPGHRVDDFMKIRNCACGLLGAGTGLALVFLLQESPFPAQLLAPAGSSSQSKSEWDAGVGL